MMNNAGQVFKTNYKWKLLKRLILFTALNQYRINSVVRSKRQQ